MADRIRLVIFDWAGTTVDHGCVAPVAPFIEVLRRHGVGVTEAEARGPMGLDKRDHLRALLALPSAAQQWRDGHSGAPATENDIDALFEQMVPLAIESVREHTRVIDGVPEMARELRQRGIAIGATTGYFAEAAKVCVERAAADGYAPDASFCVSDVPQGRPAPWMIYKNMEALGVFPASAVLKVGDTVPDIEEGRNAGCWTAGVTASSSDVGLTAGALAALSTQDRAGRIGAVATKLTAAGAHAIVETARDVTTLVDTINKRIAAGERP
jgi:phosphonoacetaldehyde hydrolase